MRRPTIQSPKSWLPSLRHRNRKSGSCHHILGILGHKRRTVVTGTVGDLDDLGSLKGGEIDLGDPWGIVSVDKNIPTIYFSIGLRDIGVV